jgi:hypothetical protein
VTLTLDRLQQREEHRAIVDLVGKGGHVRTVPVPDWVTTELDDWLGAAAIDRGKLFRRVNRVGRRRVVDNSEAQGGRRSLMTESKLA